MTFYITEENKKRLEGKPNKSEIINEALNKEIGMPNTIPGCYALDKVMTERKALEKKIKELKDKEREICLKQ